PRSVRRIWFTEWWKQRTTAGGRPEKWISAEWPRVVVKKLCALDPLRSRCLVCFSHRRLHRLRQHLPAHTRLVLQPPEKCSEPVEDWPLVGSSTVLVTVDTRRDEARISGTNRPNHSAEASFRGL